MADNNFTIAYRFTKDGPKVTLKLRPTAPAANDLSLFAAELRQIADQITAVLEGG